ncbi:Uncharacterized protein conserved in bacteria [Suttonella ornithocola]|uniref:Uncharacterized protein conserved in bacteria n=1 Tax=Suttonella ornithocola TaxID=279832 RepID=A0A380MZD8_9GAMM|nr:DEAD/DEAH box helicase family protein [Suttonella ornithocola]SUO97376.1 Uncharacterized protein conserved in bacteria [Suttonella ornithocola]
MAKKPMQTKPSFHQHLILNRWLLSLFGQKNLKVFKERLDDDRFLGLADDGQSKFFEQLNNRVFLTEWLNEQDLRRYDLNIVQHWQKITDKRNQIEGHTLEMKYFQYLSLLFTEIYLDWYFNRFDALVMALNEALKAYQQEGEPYDFLPYQVSDLNKIAFWNATGSGKTLLMHVNILQYQQYAQGGYDKIIVLTPNEGLSRQHLSELVLSGFSASLFDKNSGELFREKIEIIDVNKLADKHGDKTVAVEAFAGNNLVLVDEGHRGTSGTEWMARREKLIDQGFAFEYSATFGQAVAGSKTAQEQMLEMRKNKAKSRWGKTWSKCSDAEQSAVQLSKLEIQQARQTAMLEVYAKAVLFDYSYKFFYEDGYGKESLILNLRDEYYEPHHQLYLTACLLSFYQQLYLFETHQSRLEAWNIKKPLWVFVGNTVSKEDSDIQKILQFLAFFLNHPSKIQSWLADLLADNTRLPDKNGNNIFKQRFTSLMEFCGKEQALYDDILKRLFNASSRGRLTLTHLKKADGELSLSVGNYPAFGVINIGDAAGFYKTTETEKDFDSTTDDFSDGLFQQINHNTSKINILIGSKKFTEGWSSWRVSTMGLMNMGRSEGSQIIQLFGRGVRLKGYGFSLKRSLPEERPKGIHLEKLEMLNIFGINAGYMEQFKGYLKEEGITPPDEILTVNFKVQPNLPQNVKLKTLRLKDGYKDNQKLGFKRQEMVMLYEIPEKYQGKIKPIQVDLDCYPQIEAIDSQKKSTTPSQSISAKKIA